MKRSKSQPLMMVELILNLRLQFLCFMIGLTAGTNSLLALTETPYGTIVGRNVFALKPPPPPPTNSAPIAPPSTIELQGITTILGRAQVLLKIKLPSRPPEVSKDQSVILDVGQREGEVEILAIDVDSGIIRLKNQGNELTLNMKDAAKAQGGTGTPSPVMPAVGAGGVPAPVLGGSSVGGGSSVTTFGNRGNGPTTGAAVLPSRNLRSGAVGPAGSSGFNNSSTSGNSSANLSYEAQLALIEVERERIKGTKFPPIPSTVPPPSIPGR